MTLKINSKYILRFEINGKYLVYYATVTEDTGSLISFEDKYGNNFTFNSSKLISAEEMQ